MTKKQADYLWRECVTGDIVTETEEDYSYRGTRLLRMASMILPIPMQLTYPPNRRDAAKFLREWADGLEMGMEKK